MSEQPPPAEKSPGRSGFLAFWTTLPGILTGLAALLTAAVGVFSLWHSLNGSSPTAASRVGTSASVSTQSIPSAPPTISSNPAGGILRQGELSLDCTNRGSGANLEKGQAGLGIPDPDIAVPDCNYLTMVAHGSITTVQGPVDKQACVAALTAEPNGLLLISKLTVGSWACVETGGGQHVAAMHFTAVPGPGSPQLTFNYTVWQ
jgi:hypothetical protein